MKRFLLAAASVSLLAAANMGCPSPAFKQAVERYAPHQVEYARGIGDCKKNEAGMYSDDCVTMWAFPMSGLQCLLDEDDKKSVPGQLSNACACSRATDKQNQLKACSDWLNKGN